MILRVKQALDRADARLQAGGVSSFIPASSRSGACAATPCLYTGGEYVAGIGEKHPTLPRLILLAEVRQDRLWKRLPSGNYILLSQSRFKERAIKAGFFGKSGWYSICFEIPRSDRPQVAAPSLRQFDGAS